MKKTLLTLVLALTMFISYGQQVINLTPSDDIQSTIDNLSFTQPVIINLAPGTYNESLFITELPTTPVNTLTIQSTDINNKAIITDAANNVINIGIGYLNLKNLKIVGDAESAISISDSPLDNINELVIDSCVIEANNKPAISLEVQTSSQYVYDNIYITNNEINGGTKGVYINVYDDVASNLYIENNNIHNQKFISIYLEGIKNINVNKNYIEMPTNNNADYEGTCGIFLSGISNSIDTISYVASNVIKSLNVDSVDYKGVSLNNSSVDSIFIINNYINITNTNRIVHGIESSMSNGRIYHNTVNLLGDNGTAFYLAYSSGESPEIMNNIFSAENAAMFFEYETPIVSDYNNYFAGDSLPFTDGSNRYTLAQWQASNTTIDQNSIVEDPSFIGELRFSNMALNDVAPFISEVPTDINGIARNQPMCDMGAMELMFIDLGVDQELCVGDTLTLTSATAYSYVWNTGETTQSIQVTQLGTYAVTVQESEFGPIASDSVEVTQAPNSVITGTAFYLGGDFNSNDVKIELYVQHQENAFYIEKIANDYTTSTGTFMFTDVEPNYYTLRGIIQNSDYEGVVTSYYGNTVNWEEATYFNIGCGDTLNYDFMMYEVPSLSGSCTFRGRITYSSSNKSTNLTGEPVTGAEIYIAQDPNTEPIANAVSDPQGDWEVGEVDEGTGYNIKVDIPGLNLISTYTGLNIASGDTVQNNYNFVVDTTSGGGISVDTATAIFIVNNEQVELDIFPNPTTNYISINTNLVSPTNIEFTISDISGKAIYKSKKENSFVGEYNRVVDVSSLEAGVYVLNLRMGDTFYIKKIIKD